MNLSVKTTMRQLAVLAVASFFFSCEDETSLLGYKNPQSKFNISYVDIPVESSVLLLDSVRTSNFDAENDLNRVLIGQFEDTKFGDVKASAFSQYYPINRVLFDISLDSLVYDSLVLDMSVDYYVYGKDGVTAQSVDVYKLTEDLVSRDSIMIDNNTGGQQKPQTTKSFLKKFYFNDSEVPAYDMAALGSKSFSVDFNRYNQEINDATPDQLDISIRLDNTYGLELFNVMADTNFIKQLNSNYRLFFTKFKGVAIVPTSGDKVIGLDSVKLRMHYHTLKGDGVTVKQKYQVDFTPSRSGSMANFSLITSERGASDLAGLANHYEDFQPASEKRYIQAGTGVVTKLDFSKFNDFADTIEHMVINSAEFLISNVDDPGYFTPPPNLVVKLINDDNRPKKLSFPGRSSKYVDDVKNINLYQGFINFDGTNKSTFYSVAVPFDSTINIINDVRSFFTLNYSSTDKKYSGTASLFFQQLFLNEDGKTPFTKAILVPYSPSSSSTGPAYGRHVNGKMLNRVAFDKDNIVLRIYYTVPTVHSNQ